MNRIVIFVTLAVALILGVGALSAAQDAAPGVGSETGDVCASPAGSPESMPVELVVLATPDVDLGASPVSSPEATPGVLVACASPAVGTPAPVSEVAVEASPV